MKRVIIVEDEQIIRTGLKLTFDWARHNCVVVGEASDGKEGLQLIESLLPEIVIADIKMPEMDGLTMIKKGLAETQFVSLILTSHSEFEFAKKAIRIGVSDFLLKPLDHEELAQALDSAIKQLDSLAKAGSLGAENSPYLKGSDQPQPMTRHVREAVEYIHDHYEEKIILEDIVISTGMSATYLHKKFKEEMNTTINQYITLYRINKAVELMRQGEDHIYRIAEDVGFSDYKYFASVFKKKVKYTPTEFVKSLNKVSQ